MKKVFFVIVLMACAIFSGQLSAQAPLKFSYQAIVRDQLGNIYGSAAANYSIAIRDGSQSGTIVYQESHMKATNPFGLLTLEIGNGQNATCALEDVDWSSGKKYLDISVDMGYGMVPMGCIEMLSVPYALYAKKAEIATQGIQAGDLLYWNGASWVVLDAGTEGQTLRMCDGLPHWGDCATSPSLFTLPANNISSTSLTSGGYQLEDNGEIIMSRGICWDTLPGPTTNSNITINGSGTHAYISTISGLHPGTTYYFRAYAINGKGIGYGDELKETLPLH